MRALRGDTQGALATLRRSVEFGYDQFDHMQPDPDLEALRSLPGHQALLMERRWVEGGWWKQRIELPQRRRLAEQHRHLVGNR